jgi:hypothetical protein
MRLRDLLHEFERGGARDECMTVVKMRSRSREICSMGTQSVRKHEKRAKYPDLDFFRIDFISRRFLEPS